MLDDSPEPRRRRRIMRPLKEDKMLFNTDILRAYLAEAPIYLALERVWECEIYKQMEFQRPILDLGCGDGIFAKILFNEKIDTGLDPLRHELAYARNLDVYRELLNSCGNKIPKQDNSFSTIYSNSALEHIQDIESVLKEMYRVLKPRGKLYITVPTDKFDKYTVGNTIFSFLPSMQNSYRKYFNYFWKHYHCYGADKWINIFEKNGFKFMSATGYGSREQCMFKNLMIIFTLPNYIAKKLLNRYYICPSLRKYLSAIIANLIYKKAMIEPLVKDGGLIFLAFTKD